MRIWFAEPYPHFSTFLEDTLRPVWRWGCMRLAFKMSLELRINNLKSKVEPFSMISITGHRFNVSVWWISTSNLVFCNTFYFAWCTPLNCGKKSQTHNMYQTLDMFVDFKLPSKLWLSLFDAGAPCCVFELSLVATVRSFRPAIFRGFWRKVRERRLRWWVGIQVTQVYYPPWN